jgi:hypothetical protein
MKAAGGAPQPKSTNFTTRSGRLEKLSLSLLGTLTLIEPGPEGMSSTGSVQFLTLHLV